MLVIKVNTPSGTRFSFVPAIDPSEDVVRAEVVFIPYLWSNGELIYITEKQYSALSLTPEYDSKEASGSSCVRGKLPKIVLILGEHKFIFSGFPAGAADLAKEVERYVRYKVETAIYDPPKTVIIDFTQSFWWDSEILITLSTADEAEEILQLLK